MNTRALAYLLSATTLASLPLAAPAYAQGETATRQHGFSIPAARLSQSVLALSEQAGVQVVFDSDTTGSVMGNAVSGTMSLDDALGRLLSGTGLNWRWLKSGVVTIERVGGADGEKVTGAVKVEGAQGSPYFGGAGQAAGVNGTNGSRDITATEGTGSFTSGATTIGSKVPQALKDVPQSISVLTNARMEQQNVTDLTTAMRQLPGVTLVQGAESTNFDFYSRGFYVNTFQIDGGAPLLWASSTGSSGNLGRYGYFPQIDMSVYDHVELLRGAAGNLSGYGNPGGVVNLVRKKPLDHGQVSLEAQAGSWQNYRVVLDATSPLALDGRLRGRVVMTYQNNHHFYNIAKDDKTLIYGIGEFDLTPTTLITAGASYTRQHSVPWSRGLPRYWNGDDLELPRSTALAFPWNRWDFDTLELFGGIEQQLGGEWTLKLNLTKSDQTSQRKVGYAYQSVSPEDGTGPRLEGEFYDYSGSQFSVDGALSGAFEIFGQRQEVTIGASRVSSDGGDILNYDSLIKYSFQPYQPYPGGPIYCADYGLGYCPPNSIVTPATPPIDVFNFDPTNPLYNEPANPLPAGRFPISRQIQWGAYANMRLTAFDRLHLTGGIRWSHYQYDYLSEYLCTTTTGDCAGKQIGDVYVPTYISGAGVLQHSSGDNFSWPPSGTLSYDVTKAITAYVGYTDIYVNQSQYLTTDQQPLPPVTGSNWEVGVKWAPNGGRLNLSLSAYSITQNGFARQDYSIPSSSPSPGVTCCYYVDDRAYKSKGIDFEVTGEILTGLQVSASFTHSENKQEGSAYGSSSGKPFVTIQPKNLYKLWASYDFGAGGRGGALSGLTASFGLNGQSSAFYSGVACPGTYYAPYPEYLPTYTVCSLPMKEYAFTVPSYVVVSGLIDYRFSEHWSLAVNLENILDKTYYQTTGADPSGGNWYGAPRSFTATLRAKW